MKPAFRAALVAAVAVAAGCSPSKTELATVNGKPITKDDLTARVLQGPESKVALRSIILYSIVEDAAAKQAIKVSDADVSLYLQARKLQMPPGRLEELTAATGTTDARIRQDARGELLLRALQMQGVKVSDESIKKMYDTDPGNAFTIPEWVQIGFIITKDKADADNAISALKQGADYATVAGKFTIPAAKPQGVALQWLGILKGAIVNDQRQPVGNLEPVLKTALTKTPQGKASAPIGIPGQSFQRILFVSKRVPGSKMPLDEVKSDIAYMVAGSNNQIKPTTLEDIVKAAKIEVKADQFKDLSQPDVLLSRQAGGARAR